MLLQLLQKHHISTIIFDVFMTEHLACCVDWELGTRIGYARIVLKHIHIQTYTHASLPKSASQNANESTQQIQRTDHYAICAYARMVNATNAERTLYNMSICILVYQMDEANCHGKNIVLHADTKWEKEDLRGMHGRVHGSNRMYNLRNVHSFILTT